MARKQMSLIPDIDEDKKKRAEDQILKRRKESDFDIREYPVDVVVKKFVEKLEDDKAELFIPDYQREMIWSDSQQARFIESVLLDLPVPYLYVADVLEGENEGRLEIVDGSQRIRTLVRFLQNDLMLRELEILDELNGFYFEDFPLSRQLRFKRKTMRMIELTEVDEEARRQLFDRLNSGGTKLTDMEQRFGSRDGSFMKFIRELSSDERFRNLCPISVVRVRHREYEELVLRFFAYSNGYESFKKRVDDFLDEYLDEMNAGFDEAKFREEFNLTMEFVERYFPDGFRKNQRNQSVPRIRFEALAVGVNLALREDPEVVPNAIDWIESDEFKKLTRSDASNSLPKLINRIHYVRDNILGRDVEYSDGSE